MAADDKFRHIKDLRPAMKNVTCVFIVVDKGTTNQTKDGSVVRKCRVADKTASISFSLWNEQAEAVEPGDILRLTKGYSSLWKGSMVLYSGKYGILEKIGEFTMVYSETPDMSDPSHDFVQQLQQGGTRGGGGGASQGGSNGMERGSASGTHETRNGGGRNGSGYGIAGNRNGNNHNPPPLANGTGPSHYSPLNHSNPAPPSSFDSQTPPHSSSHYPSHQHRGPPSRSEYQQQPQPNLEPPYEASSRSHRHYPRGANSEGRYHPYSRPSNEAGAGGGWR